MILLEPSLYRSEEKDKGYQALQIEVQYRYIEFRASWVMVTALCGLYWAPLEPLAGFWSLFSPAAVFPPLPAPADAILHSGRSLSINAALTETEEFRSENKNNEIIVFWIGTAKFYFTKFTSFGCL